MDRYASSLDEEIVGSTQVCIVPGYEFQLCDGLVTNFHQPDSTLLLLVSALVGRERLMEIYAHLTLTLTLTLIGVRGSWRFTHMQ